MSNIKKTIIVNPELFKFTSGSQTRKNKDKQSKPLPVVSPNHLKTKLLNRIKKEAEINSKLAYEMTSPVLEQTPQEQTMLQGSGMTQQEAMALTMNKYHKMVNDAIENIFNTNPALREDED